MDGNSFGIGQRIALLAGGNSPEREVSLASGQQVARALAKAGYTAVLIDPLEVRLQALDWPSFHACFIALHGGAGEDGRVQAELEQFGIAYTGSGPAASRLAMSKSAAKERFLRRDVPTPPYVVFPVCQPLDEVAALVARLDYPLVMKPNGQGSSLGVSVVEGPSELPRALAAAAKFDSHVLVERLVRGREFTVALLNRDPLPLIEVVAPGQLFTYDIKYTVGASQQRFETGLPADVESRIYSAAMAAAEALGAAGLVRVDLMLDDAQQPCVLEVNTVPGLTEHSLAPRAARAAGMEMPALVDWMIREALERCIGRSSTRQRAATGTNAHISGPRRIPLAMVEDAA